MGIVELQAHVAEHVFFVFVFEYVVDRFLWGMAQRVPTQLRRRWCMILFQVLHARDQRVLSVVEILIRIQILSVQLLLHLAHVPVHPEIPFRCKLLVEHVFVVLLIVYFLQIFELVQLVAALGL